MLDFAAIGLKLLGWGGSFLKWLQTLPWYVIALVIVTAAFAYERHGWTEADKKEAADQAELKTERAKFDTEAASLATLQSALAEANAAISGYQTSMAQVQTAAAAAKAQAVQDAQGRQAALQALKAAQARPVVNDCAAPPAHRMAKEQL